MSSKTCIMPQTFVLGKALIDAVDLTPAHPYVRNKVELHDGKYYALLSCLASQLEGALIVDAGTLYGVSAAVLALAGDNRVLTYDIEDHGARETLREIVNVECRCENILQADWPIVYSSALIFLDVDPHDGLQEREFILRLFALRYKGTVVCDDIRLNEGMKEFWEWCAGRVPWRRDVTHLGHETGTGILCFGRPIILEEDNDAEEDA